MHVHPKQQKWMLQMWAQYLSAHFFIFCQSLNAGGADRWIQFYNAVLNNFTSKC